MAKFVARTFTPGDILDRDNGHAFNTAWEAWAAHAEDRFKAEAEAAGKAPEDYVVRMYSVWGDMNELAQPDAYDNDGLFHVASAGDHWYASKGTGTMWDRTPGKGRDDTTDLGIVYMVEYTTEYVGL